MTGDLLAIDRRLREGIALYIHIPFCKRRCHYCDFNTYARMEGLMASYAAGLAQEMGLWGHLLGQPRINTIYLGGGTPSYLPLGLTASILEATRRAFTVAPDVEISLEANPGDLDPSSLRALLEMGVNRLSIGFQSLEDPLLRLLGRRHTAEEAIKAYRLAREAGFPNINIDLLYGVPRQTLKDWQATLEGVIALAPDHISLYCLTLEEGTPMERRVRRGELPEPNPDLAADMYLLAEGLLGRAGYHHYEISNWALPGYECLHNLTYWLNRPYLGVGAGAHSYLPPFRFHTTRSPRRHLRRVHRWAQRGPGRAERWDRDVVEGIAPLDGVEPIERRLEMAETMFLGLRLLDGLSLGLFRERFGVEATQVYGEQIEELTGLGLLEEGGGTLRLSPRGRLLANQVFMRFLG